MVLLIFSCPAVAHITIPTRIPHSVSESRGYPECKEVRKEILVSYTVFNRTILVKHEPSLQDIIFLATSLVSIVNPNRQYILGQYMLYVICYMLGQLLGPFWPENLFWGVLVIQVFVVVITIPKHDFLWHPLYPLFLCWVVIRSMIRNQSSLSSNKTSVDNLDEKNTNLKSVLQGKGDLYCKYI